jgi:tetraacyldisaccharide 4'-kinase
MQAFLLKAWQRRGWVACLLWPVSLVYRLLLALTRLSWSCGLRRAVRLPVPVVVVGNVVAGGAGKTPVVRALALHLQQRGVPVGIVSRGFGRGTHDTREVLADSAPHEVGDEPLWLQRECRVPVFVGRRRAEAGAQLLQNHPQVRVLLSDDGLQHHGLARDLELLVFDDRGIGNGWLLPAGPLREPWPREADLVLGVTPLPLSDDHSPRRYLMQRQLSKLISQGGGRTDSLCHWRGKSITAVAGIARPQVFFDMLRSAGLDLKRSIALPDHHPYLEALPVAPDEVLMCTAKDAAKLWVHHPQAWCVALEVTFEPAFWDALDERLKALAII